MFMSVSLSRYKNILLLSLQMMNMKEEQYLLQAFFNSLSDNMT